MLLGLCAALGAAVLFGVGSVVQAVAVRRLRSLEGLTVRLVVDLVSEPVFLGALALNLCGFGFHLVALRTLPLFLAQSGIAASLVVTALLAVRLFHDHLGPSDWTAVAAVVAGLALLAAASGDVGDEHASTAFTVGLVAAIGSIAIVGFWAARADGALATAALGLLAGFGFAGVSISARILPSLTPADLVVSAPTYTLLLSGGLAFLLYSLALQRGSVTGATAPMIVSQTVTPALVGVVLLDDGVRSGWLPVALAAFVITSSGAVALARFEASPDHPAPSLGDGRGVDG